MQDRPEWVRCITHTHVDLLTKTWCGRNAEGWNFVDASHAAENGRKDGRLVACRKCVAAICKALSNGNDDPEYR